MCRQRDVLMNEEDGSLSSANRPSVGSADKPDINIRYERTVGVWGAETDWYGTAPRH